MIKSLSAKVILVFSLVSSCLSAGNFDSSFETHSLIGFETGYSRIDIKNDDTPVYKETKSMANAALKIGAETDEYRMFLSTRYYSIGTFEYLYTYGVEFHEKYSISGGSNFFVGVNGGFSNIKYKDDTGVTRITSSPYIGAETGFNIALDKQLDIELGLRYMDLQDASNTINGITYKFDNLVSSYVSIIMKYKMD